MAVGTEHQKYEAVFKQSNLGASTSTMMSTQASAQTSGLGEIILTARKRAENTKDVPIAISALNEVWLQVSESYGVKDLANIIPTLQFRPLAQQSLLMSPQMSL